MPIVAYLHHQPRLDESVSVHPTAMVVGKVTVRGPARIGAGAVLRADQSPITAGPRVCIGRGSTVHVEVAHPTALGQDVWVGDGAVVHSAVVGDGVRVEAGAFVLSWSALGSGSVVAQGSLVPEAAAFPENSYISGVPGRRLRDTTPEERAETRRLVTERLSESATTQ